jgi:hypothetical protein
MSRLGTVVAMDLQYQTDCQIDWAGVSQTLLTIVTQSGELQAISEMVS